MLTEMMGAWPQARALVELLDGEYDLLKVSSVGVRLEYGANVVEVQMTNAGGQLSSVTAFHGRGLVSSSWRLGGTLTIEEAVSACRAFLRAYPYGGTP